MVEREWLEKDFYKILGVGEGAGDKDITRAYRKLAKEHHPDTNPGSEERFKEISAAYDVLGDAEKRKEYDDVRRLGPMGAGVGGAGFRFNQGDFTNVGDFADIFGNLFGGSRRARTQRGADVETALHLQFADAVKGVTTTVTLPSTETCHVCSGQGAAPGTGFVTCERCQGRGVLNDDQGPFAMSSICPVCQGRGGRIVTPCANCHGTGREPSARSVNVKVPAGVSDHQRIRLKGKGSPGTGGGPPGDLFVDVHVSPDSRFGRKGRNVTTSVNVSATAAMLGTTAEVATLDSPVNIKVPAGTQPGKVMRVRGRGVPASGGHGAGDLLVTIVVELPRTLSKSQRQLVERLDESLRVEESHD